MITFDDLCNSHGLDPDETRKKIKGEYRVSIEFRKPDDATRATAMQKFLQWVIDNWIDGKDMTESRPTGSEDNP